MLPPPFLHRKAADSSIMTDCNRTANWMVHDVTLNIVDSLMILILKIWQQVGHLHCWH